MPFGMFVYICVPVHVMGPPLPVDDDVVVIIAPVVMVALVVVGPVAVVAILLPVEPLTDVVVGFELVAPPVPEPPPPVEPGDFLHPADVPRTKVNVTHAT